METGNNRTGLYKEPTIKKSIEKLKNAKEKNNRKKSIVKKTTEK